MHSAYAFALFVATAIAATGVEAARATAAVRLLRAFPGALDLTLLPQSTSATASATATMPAQATTTSERACRLPHLTRGPRLAKLSLENAVRRAEVLS